MKIILIASSLFVVAYAFPQFSGPVPRRDIAHKEVIQAAAYEAQLHPNLLNPFYKNPRLRPFLAKSSWFGPGEKLVKNREAEKIPRRAIYNVLNHAGLLPQQQL